MTFAVDLNGDVGEGFGHYSLGSDAELLALVSSANIACGFHAGDSATMRATVRLCRELNVAAGAHPGYPDLVGFGRRNMALSPPEIEDIVVHQIGSLLGFCQAEGVRLSHVKPHGALYHRAACDAEIAQAIARAVASVDRSLRLVGLSGSELIAAGKAAGLTTVSEVFADRTYQADGSLTPRTAADGLIHNPQLAAERVVKMVRHGSVISQQGTPISVQAETVCVHGDHPEAVAFAREIRRLLLAAGVEIRAPQS
jgi:5-oxoprolinase (ATP-hydrolysing) subunit A